MTVYVIYVAEEVDGIRQFAFNCNGQGTNSPQRASHYKTLAEAMIASTEDCDDEDFRNHKIGTYDTETEIFTEDSGV